MRSIVASLSIMLTAGLLASTSPSAQTIKWEKTGPNAGDVTITPAPLPAGWSQPLNADPSNPSTLVMTSVGTPSPGGGQRIRAMITSNFLFNNPNGLHFALGLNYSPVYSNYDWNWGYGVMGNQGALLIMGNNSANCPVGVQFESVYAVTAYSPWYPWYPYGVSPGANGSFADFAECAPMLAAETTPGSGIYQMYVEYDAKYDGQVSLMVAPNYGSFIFAYRTHNWASWFTAAAGGMPMHAGVGAAPIFPGSMPYYSPGSPANGFIQIDYIEIAGY